VHRSLHSDLILKINTPVRFMLIFWLFIYSLSLDPLLPGTGLSDRPVPVQARSISCFLLLYKSRFVHLFHHHQLPTAAKQTSIQHDRSATSHLSRPHGYRTFFEPHQREQGADSNRVNIPPVSHPPVSPSRTRRSVLSVSPCLI
jgi:hypothetical protein